MSEAKRVARVAKGELELTRKAFTELRKRHIEEILAATAPEGAYEGVLAVRALDSVVASLEAATDSALIEEEAEQYAD